MEVLRTVGDPCRRDVVMDGNREIMCVCELKNRVKRLIVDPRNIPVRQESQIVVTEEYLPDTAPYAGIEGIHTLYMFDGMFIGRIESAYEGVYPFLVLGIEFLVFFRHDRIGGAVVIALAIVIEIVFRSFPLIFGPLLGYRKSEHDRLLYIGAIHMSDQILESRCFLKEIHCMDMGIDHRVS